MIDREVMERADDIPISEVEAVERLLALWDSDGQETYRDFAIRIVKVVIRDGRHRLDVPS